MSNKSILLALLAGSMLVNEVSAFRMPKLPSWLGGSCVQELSNDALVAVVGIGGAGGNVVNGMRKSREANGEEQLHFISVNTDVQDLERSVATGKVLIGEKSTQGMGTGANPGLGRLAAQESIRSIMDEIGTPRIAFLTAGMGGGTGSGAISLVSEELRRRGVLTVAVVTEPFAFEGARRARVATDAIAELKKVVDAIIIVQNQRLLEHVGAGVSMVDAFKMVDHVLDQAVRAILEIVLKPGHINIDLADMCSILKNMGAAVIGVGTASGSDRALQAAKNALTSPLIKNVDIANSKRCIVNITGGMNLGLHEVSVIASYIEKQVDKDAHIIVGSVFDESLGEEVRVSVVVTGVDTNREQQ